MGPLLGYGSWGAIEMRIANRSNLIMKREKYGLLGDRRWESTEGGKRIRGNGMIPVIR